MRSKICLSAIQSFFCGSTSNVSFRTEQGKAELSKQKVTVVSVAVETTKFLSGMCDCTVDSDVATGDFSLVPGILHVSPDTGWHSSHCYCFRTTPLTCRSLDCLDVYLV